MQFPVSSTICGIPGARKSAESCTGTCPVIFGKNGACCLTKAYSAELSDTYREPLVERAVSLYDGKSLRNMRT